MGIVTSLNKHVSQKAAPSGTYPTATLVLEAYDRLFGAQDAAAERQAKRDERWQRAEVERASKQRL